MSALKSAIPVLLLLAAFPAASPAQSSLFKTTYRVEVKYETWRNGSTYWATEFETSSLQDAQLMYELLESALEEGSICEILGCGFDWIIVDVRITTKYEYIQPAWTWYQQAIPFYRSF